MTYKISVHLRNKRTGATRIYDDGLEYDEPFNDYIWSEGAYSCDCNRSLFLYDFDEEQALPCKTEDGIIVIDKIIRQDTGEILYSETVLCGNK